MSANETVALPAQIAASLPFWLLAGILVVRVGDWEIDTLTVCAWACLLEIFTSVVLRAFDEKRVAFVACALCVLWAITYFRGSSVAAGLFYWNILVLLIIASAFFLLRSYEATRFFSSLGLFLMSSKILFDGTAWDRSTSIVAGLFLTLCLIIECSKTSIPGIIGAFLSAALLAGFVIVNNCTYGSQVKRRRVDEPVRSNGSDNVADERANERTYY